MRKNRALPGSLLAVVLLLSASGDRALADREPVLKQINVPHNYYFREMYLPQLTTGPSSLSWSTDGERLVYSMNGSLWKQDVDSRIADERRELAKKISRGIAALTKHLRKSKV